MKSRLLALVPLATAVAVTLFGACHDDDDGRSATLVGTFDQATFAYPVTRIITTGDDGRKTVTEVDASGAFSVELDRGQSYSFAVDTDLGSYPLVLGGNHGRYALSVHIAKGSPSADVGTVRFYDPAEAPYAFSDVCVGGYFEDSLEPCMAEQAKIACGKRGRDHHDDGDDQGSSAPWEPLDTQIAVPTFSLPATLACRRGGGHDDDDGGHDDDDGGHDDDDGGYDDDDGGYDDDDGGYDDDD